LPGAGVVDDPVPPVVPCEPLVPVPVVEVDEPVDEVEPVPVVEVEPLAGSLVPVGVDVVDDTVDVSVEVDDPLVWPPVVESVPARLGAAPPPPIIVELPPVGCDFSLVGTVTVVVVVVTVVGIVEPVAGATVAAELGAGVGEIAVGAACTGGPVLWLVAGAADCGVTGWLAGATSAARARW
jgi:hypothetical protein